MFVSKMCFKNTGCFRESFRNIARHSGLFVWGLSESWRHLCALLLDLLVKWWMQNGVMQLSHRQPRCDLRLHPTGKFHCGKASILKYTQVSLSWMPCLAAQVGLNVPFWSRNASSLKQKEIRWQPSVRRPFPSRVDERKKALASAGHVISLYQENLGVIN